MDFLKVLWSLDFFATGIYQPVIGGRDSLFPMFQPCFQTRLKLRRIASFHYSASTNMIFHNKAIVCTKPNSGLMFQLFCVTEEPKKGQRRKKLLSSFVDSRGDNWQRGTILELVVEDCGQFYKGSGIPQFWNIQVQSLLEWGLTPPAYG